MGSGTWTSTSFADYTTTTKGATLDSLGAIDASLSNQELFKAIAWLDKNVHNIYGTFNYKCDYFQLNKKYYDEQMMKESCSNE